MNVEQLKDAFKLVDASSSINISLMKEMREFLKEKTSLEKEYSHKLESIAKKYAQKMESRKASSGTYSHIYSETWVTAWENTLSQSIAFSKKLNESAEECFVGVLESFKTFEKKEDESRHKLSQYHQDLLGLYEKSVADKDKGHTKYLESYNNVHKLQVAGVDPIEKKMTEAYTERLHRKIAYLLSIEVANSTQKELYDRQIPQFYTWAQESIENRLINLANIWEAYYAAQYKTADQFRSYIDTCSVSISHCQPNVDAENSLSKTRAALRDHITPTLIDFTNTHWPTDTKEFNHGEESAHSYLVNSYSKLEGQFGKMKLSLSMKGKELEGLKTLEDAYAQNPSLGNAAQVKESWIEVKKEVSFLEVAISNQQAQLDKIKSYIGDASLGLSGSGTGLHRFKPSSFGMSSHCDHCKSSVWGLSKSAGFICEDCGYICHAKCQLKVSPYCEAGRVKRPSSNKGLSGSGASSPTAASHSSSMGAVGSGSDSRPPSPTTSIASQLKGLGMADFAVALYDYTSQNEDELNLQSGEKYMVLNDPSSVEGWIKVQNEKKVVGLVPVNYIKIQTSDSVSQKSMSKSIESTMKPLAPVIRSVKALYDYQAASADELTLCAGDMIQVTKESDDGWWEGSVNGKQGVFPSNYVAPAN